MYNALIIGAGQIAGGFDDPSDKAILTHAHAYCEHDGFNLLGFFDSDFSRAAEMCEKWNCKGFKTLEDIKDIDIISICTPDKFHLSVLKEALKLSPKLIFLEKPLSDNIEEAKEILKISKKIPILVNYSRRFVSEFQMLADKIKNREFGEFLSGNGYYGKGFVHNGSHMTNLLELLVGKITKVDIVNEFEDFYPKDKTKTAILTINNNKFTMNGIDCRNYTIFELDLLFKKARLRILDSGQKIEIYEVKENKKYKGYRNLVLKETINTELDFAMLNAVENIYQNLKHDEPLKSTVKQALEVINYD